MADFIFTSPGVKFKEKDLSFITRNVGITTLGLVGETEKGPAFEPVYVQDGVEFRRKFGNQNITRFPNGELKYQLPYVANAYLDESNQMYVTRVLGLSGYDAGTGWAITVKGGVDTETIEIFGTPTTNVAQTIDKDETYVGDVVFLNVGEVGEYETGFVYDSGLSKFVNTRYEYEVTDDLGTQWEYTETITTEHADVNDEYDNMVVAVIRSRGRVTPVVNEPSVTTFDATDLTLSGNTSIINTGDLFGNFTLVASTPNHIGSNPSDSDSYVVSLNPNASNYIANTLGRTAKDKNTRVYVEAVYPDLIKKLDADGLAFGVEQVIDLDTNIFTNRKTSFKTPETPWVVSQLKGNKVDRLFKFISISDGNSANREHKISITNINPQTGEFDVVIRDYFDTDANPIPLESFVRCSLNKNENSFIGNRIGTNDDEYELRSEYIMIELASDIDVESYPVGFEGYWLNNYDSAKTPEIFYKTSYEEGERVNRIFLGISNHAYDGENLRGTGINQNLFNFTGFDFTSTSNFTQTKGFHLDSDVEDVLGDMFVGGMDKIQTVNDVLSPTNAYNDPSTRKFTLVPYGGFDGWDIHANGRTHGDNFRKGGIYDGVEEGFTPTTDYQAWETAIDTFSNPETITINLFSTPGINWSDNNTLINETINMIETRADSLYIIDSPDIKIEQTVGQTRTDVLAARNIADLMESTRIDSNYSCTYYPWVQIRDVQNNSNIYIPPTGEVVAAIAFTDNNKFPWFAPAGLQRGVTNAKRARYRLSNDARDILYKSRINPMADFAGTGTAIFGQKTLQIRESALDRINVRRLLLQIKVLISNVAVRLLFEQNDQTTIDQFLAQVNPILDTIKRERGLYEYQIKMDDSINTPETRDRNELYGELFLKPTRSLEKIGITFNIMPSGASFEDV